MVKQLERTKIARITEKVWVSSKFGKKCIEKMVIIAKNNTISSFGEKGCIPNFHQTTPNLAKLK